MVKPALLFAIVTMLSGCSGLMELPVPRDYPSPDNAYRRIVSQSGQVSTLRAQPTLANFEIAGLRPAVAPQPGEWMTCLRATETVNGNARPAYFGVFLRQWTVVDVRRGVFLDGCDHEQYSALESYPAAKADPLPKPRNAEPADGESGIEEMSQPR